MVAVECADRDETRGVNSKEQLATIERIAQRRIASELMGRGTTLADPARIDVRGNVNVGTEVSIDVGCVFEGQVDLADGVRIGPYCVLRNCSIGAGTEVLPFSHLDGATIGAAARIGPYARLRPGVLLADRSSHRQLRRGQGEHDWAALRRQIIWRTSATRWWARTSTSARVPSPPTTTGRVSIAPSSAMTCSIGSNAVLVAPVTIGQGATIAGGSTISRNAPEGKLTVARAKQTTLDGWKRPTKEKKG